MLVLGLAMTPAICTHISLARASHVATSNFKEVAIIVMGLEESRTEMFGERHRGPPW